MIKQQDITRHVNHEISNIFNKSTSPILITGGATSKKCYKAEMLEFKNFLKRLLINSNHPKELLHMIKQSQHANNSQSNNAQKSGHSPNPNRTPNSPSIDQYENVIKGLAFSYIDMINCMSSKDLLNESSHSTNHSGVGFNPTPDYEVSMMHQNSVNQNHVNANDLQNSMVQSKLENHHLIAPHMFHSISKNLSRNDMSDLDSGHPNSNNTSNHHQVNSGNSTNNATTFRENSREIRSSERSNSNNNTPVPAKATESLQGWDV